MTTEAATDDIDPDEGHDPTPLLRLTDDLPRWSRLVLPLVAVVAVAVVAWTWRSQPLTAFGLAAMVAIGAWLTAIDLAVHRLPNAITGPLALGVTIWLLVAGVVVGNIAMGWSALAVGFVASLIFLVANLTLGMGMGDVKYAYPVYSVAAWFGWPSVRLTLMVMVCTAAAVAIGVLARHRSRRMAMAYGPYMALGLTVAVIAAAPG